MTTRPAPETPTGEVQRNKKQKLATEAREEKKSLPQRSSTNDQGSEGCLETLEALIPAESSSATGRFMSFDYGDECLCEFCVPEHELHACDVCSYPEQRDCACVLAGQADQQLEGEAKDKSELPTAQEEDKGTFESKYSPPSRKRKNRKTGLTITIPRDPSSREVEPLNSWSEDEEDNYWGDPQPAEHEVPVWPGDPVESDDNEIQEWLVNEFKSDGSEGRLQAAGREVIREAARNRLISDYKWDESTKAFVDVPDSFQDAFPAPRKARKTMLRERRTTSGRRSPARGLLCWEMREAK
jgi:hypothetical protein